MLNAKKVNIAYSTIETEIIDDVLYVVFEDGSKLDLVTYMDCCSLLPSFGDCFQELNFWDNAYCGFLTFGVDGKYGYIDLETGRVACEPKWDWVSLFSRDGYALVNIGCDPVSEEEVAYEVTPRKGRLGLIDYNFNIVVPTQYDSVEWNVCCVIANRRSRYCNVPPRYSGPVVRKYNLNENQPTNKEWFVVSKDGQWGIIDRSENIIIPYGNSSLYVLSRECVLRKDGSMLYAGGKSIPLDDVYVCKSFYETKVYLIVKRSRKYAVVRDDGTFASDFKFTFEQAKQFVDIQFDGRTIIGKMV